MKTTMVLTTRLILLASTLAGTGFGQVTVDGNITGDSYGPAVSVQTVQTYFGDNVNELDAAYATINSGRFYLALTGNLQVNYCRLEILIDSIAGGEHLYSGVPGNDGTGVMAGFTLDAGFEADFHLILRHGPASFDVDIATLGTANFSHYSGVFGPSSCGAGTTGTGPANASPLQIACDNSNIAGIVGGTGAADQTLAVAVTTGIEMSIDLADLGSPPGEIRICVFINSPLHNYASNQFLAGLSPPQGNLGGDGAGHLGGGLTFNLGDFAGDQFFTVGGSSGAAICFGDGTGAGCPCFNIGGSGEGCANGTGSGGTLTASGTPSVTADTMSLTADGVINNNGLFFQGNNTIAGGNGTVFGDGIRCCGGSVVRIQVVNPPGTTSPATAQMTETATTNGPPGTITAGTKKCYQFWYRDPATSPCGAQFNLTNAVTVTWVP